jgi:hypothetical protein
VHIKRLDTMLRTILVDLHALAGSNFRSLTGASSASSIAAQLLGSSHGGPAAPAALLSLRTFSADGEKPGDTPAGATPTDVPAANAPQGPGAKLWRKWFDGGPDAPMAEGGNGATFGRQPLSSAVANFNRRHPVGGAPSGSLGDSGAAPTRPQGQGGVPCNIGGWNRPRWDRQQQQQQQQQQGGDRGPRRGRRAERDVRDIIAQPRPAPGGRPGGFGGPRGGGQHRPSQYARLAGATDVPQVYPRAGAAHADEASPDRVHPYRLFYPGQSYVPDDLDPYKGRLVPLEALGRRKPVASAKRVLSAADFRNPGFLTTFLSGKDFFFFVSSGLNENNSWLLPLLKFAWR